MDKTIFWQLIDTSRTEAEGDPDQQMEVLGEKLALLSPNEIVAFDRIFSEYHHRAYDWGLWGAAYLIGGGCSDDGFMDFRAWLISKGESVFEAALGNPDSLAEVMTENDDDGQIEGFQYIAANVWSDKTGEDYGDFPRHDLAFARKPTGSEWDEDDLDALFPALSEKFS